MKEKRSWLIGGAVLGALCLAGLGWLASGDESPLGGVLAGLAGGGDLSGPEVLRGGGGLGEGDAGVGGAGRAAWGADGGGIALGPWLPTATVAADPESPYGTLTGRVVSSVDGSGVPGAELVFDRDGTTSSASGMPDGAFSLPVSEEGRYVLAIASAEGFLPYAPQWGHSPIAFEARAERRIEGVTVRLVPETTVAVEVVDGRGEAVPGATVRLIGAGEGDRSMAPVRDSYTTDEQGTAEVTAWAGALLEAVHDSEGRGRGRVGRNAERTLRIALAEARDGELADASIEGRVIDGAGAPIEGAVVRAFLPRRGLHPSTQSATDEEGRFVLLGLDDGPHGLATTHPAHPRTMTWRVEAGRRDVEIQLADGLGVEGRVVDDEGRPVPAFNVVARIARGALRRRTVASVSSYDAEGRFLVTGLEEGTYDLVATSRGFPPSAPVSVTVSGSPSSSIEITLRRGGRIEGVVTDEAGPIAGARVSLEGHIGRTTSAASSLASSVSAEDGSFVLEGLSDQPQSIRVEADGHHGRLVSGFTVPPGGARRLEVELETLGEGESPRTELVGIGVILMPAEDTLVVRRVVPGGGAAGAGLQRGDRITAVDGAAVTALGFGGALERIRGPEGTVVRLTIRRRGADEAVEIAINRQRVRT